jgi:predicted DNA binding CopG/RHH family protein
MVQKKTKNDNRLAGNAEEHEAIDDLRRDIYQRDPDLPKTIKQLKRIAAHTLRKKPITVRVQERDIERIKVKALEQGIPYQTLVSSVLHRFATGTLKDDA